MLRNIRNIYENKIKILKQKLKIVYIEYAEHIIATLVIFVFVYVFIQRFQPAVGIVLYFKILLSLKK